MLWVSTGSDAELKDEVLEPDTCKSVDVSDENPSPFDESTIPALHFIVSDPELVTLIVNDVNWSPDVGVILALIDTELWVVKDCFAVPVTVESVFDVAVHVKV